MAQIRILLVDDHTLLRQGLRGMLELSKNMVVVGEVGEGEEAIAKAFELSPDIVLMDITLPKMDGIETTRRIKEDHPEVKVIVLTMHVDDHHVLEAIKVGASGYLTKSVTQEELTRAIEVVYNGDASIYPAFSKRMMSELFSLSQGKRMKTTPLGLTEREKEILAQLCQGASNKEIAQELCITQKTVKNRLKYIFNKLNVSDRTQAVAYALRHGIIT